MTAMLPVQEIYNSRRTFAQTCTGARRRRRIALERAFDCALYTAGVGLAFICIFNAFGWFQ